MSPATTLNRRLANALREAVEGKSVPAWLEMGDSGFISVEKGAPGEFEQAREYEKRLAIQLLKDAVDAMVRANMAHVLYQRKLGQPEMDGLPFPPDKE